MILDLQICGGKVYSSLVGFRTHAIGISRQHRLHHCQHSRPLGKKNTKKVWKIKLCIYLQEGPQFISK